MTLTDEQFREEFKPLQIPAAYSPDAKPEDKILYALAQLGEATSAEVNEKLVELGSGAKDDHLIEYTDEFLTEAFKKGLLNGGKKNGILTYNLSKVTHANEGTVDPDLLALGVD